MLKVFCNCGYELPYKTVEEKYEGAKDLQGEVKINDINVCPFCSAAVHEDKNKYESMIPYIMFILGVEEGETFSLFYHNQGVFAGNPPYLFRIENGFFQIFLEEEKHWSGVNAKWLQIILKGEYRLVKIDMPYEAKPW